MGCRGAHYARNTWIEGVGVCIAKEIKVEVEKPKLLEEANMKRWCAYS